MSRIKNVQLPNVQLQNVQDSKCPGHKTSSFCKFNNLFKKIRSIQGVSMLGSHKAGSTAAIRLPSGYRRLNLTYPDIKSAHTHGLHHHGPHQSWTARRVVSRPQSWVKPQLRPRGSQRMDRIKYVISDIFCEKGFLNKFLSLQKLDVLCPGRFVIWMFCKMDVW